MKRRWKRRAVEVRVAFAEKAFWDGRAAGQRLAQPHHYFRPEDVVRGSVSVDQSTATGIALVSAMEQRRFLGLA